MKDLIKAILHIDNIKSINLKPENSLHNMLDNRKKLKRLEYYKKHGYIR